MIDILPNGSAQGVGELAIVVVDYEADEEVVVCLVTWPMTSRRSLNSCRNCNWAFEFHLGSLTYVDGSGPGCHDYDFEPSLFENTLRTFGSRESVLLSIEEADWEPIGEVTQLSDGVRWEFELFFEEDAEILE